MKTQSLLLFLFCFAFGFFVFKKNHSVRHVQSRMVSSVDESGDNADAGGETATDDIVVRTVENPPAATEAIEEPFRFFHAALIIGNKQAFLPSVEEALVEAYGSNTRRYETGQVLTPDFDRATVNNRNLCDQFIDANGNYGRLAQMIVYGFQLFPELSPLIEDSAANKAGMKNVCPNFDQMSSDQRKDFWVWTLATVALFESTCGHDTVNEANRKAVGMFQLNANVSDRAPRALLNGGICGRLTRAQIEPDNNNTACALDFMRDSFSADRWGSGAGLITDAQQWERLRNSNALIIRVLKKFKPCQKPKTI